ncbi:MAG: hypothetical protein LH614_06130 [Pyrinomonadaceae bacterium]|nr:hypothetical protein [Pyrinomonadaceae bacterium]
MRKIFFVLAVISFGGLLTDAQTADANDNQSWNDVQITVPMTDTVRFYLSGIIICRIQYKTTETKCNRTCEYANVSR